MATTTNLELDLPDIGVTDVNTAASELVAALEDVDAHDHSEGNGVKISPAGININADLEMNNNSLLETYSVELEEQTAALTGASNINRVHSVQGELYFTDGGGTAVQVTANGGLDITVSGGWTGDYSSTVAEATYIDGSTVFKLMQDGVADQAGLLDTGSIKLRTTVAAVSDYITIASPTLSSSYTLTLPDSAAAAGVALVTMDTSGNLDSTRDPSIASLSVAGDATITGDATVGGAVLATTSGVFPSGVEINGVLLEYASINGQDTVQTTAALSATAGVRVNAGGQLIDYFQEGGFTPQLFEGSNLKTVNSAEGIYMRLGNTVWVSVHILDSDFEVSSSPDDITIRNLPFTPSFANTTYYSAALSRFTLAGNSGGLASAIMSDATSQVRITTSNYTLTNSWSTSGAESLSVAFTMTYQIA